MSATAMTKSAPSLVSSLDGLLLDIKGADRKKTGLAVEALFGKKVSRLSAMRYDVKIDGVALDDVDPGSTVLEACPWLRAQLAIAMEGLRGTDAAQLPTDRGVLLAKLGEVGFLTADEVSFEINGDSITAPGDRPAYVFRRPNGTNFVVLLYNGAMKLDRPSDMPSRNLRGDRAAFRRKRQPSLAHELAGSGERDRRTERR